MSILDSNKYLLKKVERTLLVDNLTPSSDNKTFYIDTKGFNTLILSFESVGGSSSFSVKKMFANNNYSSDIFPVLNLYSGLLLRSDSVSMSNTSGISYVLDVSDTIKVQLVKNDTTGTNKIWYSLTQDRYFPETSLNDVIKTAEYEKFIQVATNVTADASTKTWYVNCEQYRKLSIVINSVPASTFTFVKGYGDLSVRAIPNIQYPEYSPFKIIQAKDNAVIGNNRNITIPQSSANVYTIDCSDCQAIKIIKTDSDAANSFIYCVLSKGDLVLPTESVKVIGDRESPVPVSVISQSIGNNFETLVGLNDFTVIRHNSTLEGKTLSAVYKNVAVYNTANSLFISTNGLTGEKHEVALNSTNFPNLIENSTINRIIVIPWHRQVSSGSKTYNGDNWRIVVFTNKSQIYHNFPSRQTTYDGAAQSGDEYRFDESVVWDLPDRINYVKTETGDDATLINTGKYKYIPCLPDHMYEMHPAINSDTGYGNGGFGAVKTYTDIDGSTQKRARFFVPTRDHQEGNSLNWLSGYEHNGKMTVIGTYAGSYNYMCRICVFATNDGREWYVVKEYAPNGYYAYYDNGLQYHNGWAAFAEYGDTNNRIKFGTNSMTDNSAYVVRGRIVVMPSADNKEPYTGNDAKKYIYRDAIAVERIDSDATNGIVVTLSRAITGSDALGDGANIVFEKASGSEGVSAWNWLCSENHTEMSAGNGTIWKIQRISGQDSKFRLMLEAKNPNEILQVRHIHSINFAKDGYLISCGEEWPNGWVDYVSIKGQDSFSNLFAGNSFPIIRLTSSKNSSVQRTLGTEMVEENGDNYIYFGSDSASIARTDVSMPTGRTDGFTRNSLGIYKGKLSDIDDINEFECLLDINEPAYFFKLINGILIFVGQQRTLALSKDMGKSWEIVQLPVNLYAASWLLGLTDNNEICIKYYDSRHSGDSLIIGCKV